MRETFDDIFLGLVDTGYFYLEIALKLRDAVTGKGNSHRHRVSVGKGAALRCIRSDRICQILLYLSPKRLLLAVVLCLFVIFAVLVYFNYIFGHAVYDFVAVDVSESVIAFHAAFDLHRFKCVEDGAAVVFLDLYSGESRYADKRDYEKHYYRLGYGVQYR